MGTRDHAVLFVRLLTRALALASLLAASACSSQPGAGADSGPGDGTTKDSTSSDARPADTARDHGLENHDAGPDVEAATGPCSISPCKSSQQCLAGQCCDPPIVDGGTCSLFGACGCAPSENCVRLMGGPEQCLMAGTTPKLGNCTLQTDCARGLVCQNGICLDPCTPASTPAMGSCPANFDCYAGYFKGVALESGACVPHCNPVSPETADSTHGACGAGQDCEIDFSNKGDTFCLSPAGTLGAGAPCAALTDCKPGYLCTYCRPNGCTTGQPHFCQQFCRVGQTDCTSGSCVSFLNPQYDGTQEIGVCTLPDAGAPDGSVTDAAPDAGPG